MRILITNDDGLHAAGLVPLIKWARQLGQVMAVVPKYEQSGKSHGIEIHKGFEVKQVELEPGITVYAVDSTPADCVRFAVLGLHETFDLVISGINRGLNVGADIMYSGTVGAIFEAASLGIRGMAVSTEPKSYDTAIEHMDRIWNFIGTHGLFEKHALYNINIAAAAGPIRITRQGGPYYSDDFILQENDMVLPRGKDVFAPSQTMERDTDAVLRGGYISIMPLTTERFDRQMYQELAKLNP